MSKDRHFSITFLSGSCGKEIGVITNLLGLCCSKVFKFLIYFRSRNRVKGFSK